ncbi:hypothetical protein JXA48_02465 [Candidatus Woesearchaeota archaeon]|nr:hypothetical protein [Candidatus Woesearchaeota archaeon]
MKIRILGGPGSGKSTLARSLEAKYGWKHIQTDDIRYTSPSDYSLIRSREERIKILNQFLKNKSWVVEGTTASDWSWATFVRADLVIVLLPSHFKEKIRLIKRSIKNLCGFEKDNPRKENFFSFLHMIRWSNQFRREVLENRLSRLKKEKIKFLICKSNEEALEIIENKMKK